MNGCNQYSANILCKGWKDCEKEGIWVLPLIKMQCLEATRIKNNFLVALGVCHAKKVTNLNDHNLHCVCVLNELSTSTYSLLIFYLSMSIPYFYPNTSLP